MNSTLPFVPSMPIVLTQWDPTPALARRAISEMAHSVSVRNCLNLSISFVFIILQISFGLIVVFMLSKICEQINVMPITVWTF